MITIKTKISEERTINIQTPIFWKEQNKYGGTSTDYLGVIDENNCIAFYNGGSYTSLIHCLAETKESAIIKAKNEWEQISEGEFMAAHKQLLQSLSLEPQLTNVDDLKNVLNPGGYNPEQGDYYPANHVDPNYDL